MAWSSHWDVRFYSHQRHHFYAIGFSFCEDFFSFVVTSLWWAIPVCYSHYTLIIQKKIRFEWIYHELINVKPDRTRRAYMSEVNFHLIWLEQIWYLPYEVWNLNKTTYCKQPKKMSTYIELNNELENKSLMALKCF